MLNLRKSLCIGLTLASLAAAATLPVLADKPAAKAAAVKSYKWRNYTFKIPSSVAMSDPTGYGDPDIANLFYPPDVKPGEPRIRVFFSTLSESSVKALEPRGKLLEAEVTSHMGLSTKPSGQKTRTIFGQEQTAGVWDDSGPPPKSFEAYCLKLPSGNHLFMALEHSTSMDPAKVEAVFNSIATTITETP